MISGDFNRLEASIATLPVGSEGTSSLIISVLMCKQNVTSDRLAGSKNEKPCKRRKAKQPLVGGKQQVF